MKKSLSGIIIVNIIFIFSLSGKNFFVDPENGNDSNDGSKAKPWKKLQYVIDHFITTGVGVRCAGPAPNGRDFKKN